MKPRHASLNRRGFRSSSGSLAMLAAMRRASSRVSKASRRPPSRVFFELDVAERLPAGVADDETPPIQRGVAA
jgi:hypothetical protein